MNKKLLLPFIVFIGLALAFMVQLARNSQGDDPKKLESVLVGSPLPDFQLTDLLDETQMLSQDIAKTGEPHLLNVWATWCPTCYAEHEYLTHLAKQGINIIGVDYKDERVKAINFLKSYNNPYKAIIYDPKGSLGLDLGVYGAPETFIVDGKGVIHYRYAGDINDKVWREVLKPIYDGLK